MVGVAGKSKGCNTCKQRKVKCDEGKVPCGPCVKSKKVCTGYRRDRLFKNLSFLDHSSLLSRSQPLVPNTEPSILRYEDNSVGTKGLGCMQWNSIPGAPNDRVFNCFMDEYMPSKTEIAVRDDKTPLSWMQIIPLMNRGHSSLGNALSALSMVRMGRKLNDKKLKRRGLALYGLALEGMQEALRIESSHDQTLASCLTMAIFELLELPGDDIRGWTSHIQGLSKLFELRGANQFSCGPSHYLFLGFRATEIIHAIATRRPTYLEDRSWLSAPWDKISKSDFHHLLDIMTQIPAALKREECFVRDSFPSSSEKTILQESVVLEHSLRSWYAAYQMKFSEPLFTTRDSCRTQNTSDLITPVQEVLDFGDFEGARIHLFYWAALLFMYTNILSVSRNTTIDLHDFGMSQDGEQLSSHFSGSPLMKTIQEVEPKIVETGMLILQSIPYLLSDDAHILGPQNVFFPLRIAQHAFSVIQGRQREVQWCKDVFHELRGRGYPIGDLLSDTSWDDIPKLLSKTQ